MYSNTHTQKMEKLTFTRLDPPLSAYYGLVWGLKPEADYFPKPPWPEKFDSSSTTAMCHQLCICIDSRTTNYTWYPFIFTLNVGD